MTVCIGVCGATGKMGQMIIQRMNGFNACTLSTTFTRKNSIDDLAEFCQNSDVIIDFSSSEILEKLLDYAISYNNKLVIGTTGLTQYQLDHLNAASKSLAILYSANMSLGANLLTVLAEKAAKILDNTYDIEILDCHHRMKKDAPSGTAIMLGKAVAKARNLDFDEYAVFDRSQKGQRQPDKIGISSIRGGQVHGEHEVLFLGNNQVLSIKHQALSKESFADGAIQAAIWLFDKPAGLYSMRDMFSLLQKC
ncbi:MAG: 4-hydroxy-tetrahydrodipicolinate reductase [Candidatus Tisiphia sp.]|jgi:4-hydroxy-tetrahydrodipicolinate reductase|uniref:4-hydroxy-tetrahydrodipicolinate reductase n=1 Tax=unclassified Candidatus Tisiphia TaxID=2996318 RepID=UPI001E78553B|nr:MAG: 4-hydroxy-tetrahydrodipicolinate reductase [Rickettsia endosymbiont of Cimex lectularius]